MSLKIVYGASGSGKSTMLQDSIIKSAAEFPKRQFILIVPDQFTMQTQMDIVKRSSVKGIMNIDVLSFSRLSYRVFSETGSPGYPVLDDTGKSLVLRRVASDISKDMPYLGSHLNKIGYIHEVKSAISEFMQYGVSVSDVEKLKDSCGSGLLKAKLSDLCVIYGAFLKYNRDKFITSEETLDILCSKIPDADFLKDAEVVFDGFTGFTPIQERVILKLLETCAQVIVSLTVSLPEKITDVGGEEKLFYLTRTTSNRLKSIAERHGIETESDECVEGSGRGRFSQNPELDHLEKNLFRHPFKQYAGTVDNIGIFSCHDAEREVEEISLRIHDLVRTGNYAYRDIAVVVGDLETYGDLFEDRMKELDMPCFIDRTNGIVLNPFTEFLKSALQIIIKDYSYDSVMHFLHSGFTDLSMDEIDRFDKYISGLNIRGKSAYHKPFLKRQKRMPKDRGALEQPLREATRQKLMESLEILERPAVTAGDHVRNLYDFLKANNSYEKLSEYEAMFNENGKLAKAREYGQIYKLIMELLEVIDGLIGEETMDLDEFYHIFEAGIGEIEVGTIPKNVDRILIGDIERTRLNEVKVLFFAGVNDGNIPKSSDKGGIISDSERVKLLESGKTFDPNFALAPTEHEAMYTQRLYLYMNLCKPVDKLFISFSGADKSGKALKPSYLVGVIRNIFPSLKVSLTEDEAKVSKIVNLKDSYRFYATLAGKYASGAASAEEKELTECLYKLYTDTDEKLFKDVTDSAFTEYVASPLAKEIVKLIYGAQLEGSISRFETYAGCAYKHFLKYGMDLKDDADADFSPADLGNVYHGVLDAFSSELEARGIPWTDFNEEECREMVEQAVRAYCEDYEQGILNDDAKSAYTIEKIIKIMTRNIMILQFHLKQGKFIPEMHEHPFKREISLSEGSMLIKGRIDRIDLYENDGKIYVKILDYKSSAHDIDITNVYHGIEQQLPLYMAEALHHEQETHPDTEVLPSAMLYYKIANPMINLDEPVTDEALENMIRKELRVSGMIENTVENISSLDENAAGDGLVLPISIKKDGSLSKESEKRTATSQEIRNMVGYTERLMKSIGERINAGDMSILPMNGNGENACEYCSYRSVCRFDDKIPGYRKRDGLEAGEDEIKEKVMGGQDNGLYLFN